MLPLCSKKYGRYWARTSDPQLVDQGKRSHPCAPVPLKGIVEPNLVDERTVERTQANENPCHSCHGSHSWRIDVCLHKYWSLPRPMRV
jgi:hypothetical protein